MSRPVAGEGTWSRAFVEMRGISKPRSVACISSIAELSGGIPLLLIATWENNETVDSKKTKTSKMRETDFFTV